MAKMYSSFGMGTTYDPYEDYSQYIKNRTSTSSDTDTSGTLAGKTSGEGSSATGYKTVVPDPVSTQASAISGNLANLGSIENLASQLNTFNQSQLLNQITGMYPQFTSTVNQLGSNISDWSKGLVSQSTINQLAQGAAQRGVAGGLGADSPAINAALMAVLGTTSEDLQSKALSGYSTLMKSLPTTTLTDLTNYMVTPAQQYNAQLLANIYKSAANPADAYNLNYGNALRGLSAGYSGAGGSAGTGMGGGTYTPGNYKLWDPGDLTGGGTSSSGGTGGYGLTDAELEDYGMNLPYTGDAPLSDADTEDYVMNLPYTGNAPVTDEEWGDWANQLYYTGEESSGTNDLGFYDEYGYF